MSFKKYVVEECFKTEYNIDFNYSLLKPLLKQKIYTDLISEDESRILSAAKIVIHLDDLNFNLKELEIIEKQCSSLPDSKRKMIRDYREDVKAGIMVIKNFTLENNQCKCPIYQNWIQFMPEREIEMGFLKLLNEPLVSKEKYQIEYELECLICGTHWQSNEINGYHYPWYKWIKK